MIDPRDPLAGLDPYPRELVDALGSDQERADLLEEIVSTPGPGGQSSPARTRVLLSLAIAAAVAVIGGAWFVASGNNGGHDDTPVAAAPATTAAATTAPTTATGTPTSTAAGPNRHARCRQLLARNGQLRGVRSLLQMKNALSNRKGRQRLYVRIDKSGRRRYVVVVGPGCTIRSLRAVQGIGHH